MNTQSKTETEWHQLLSRIFQLFLIQFKIWYKSVSWNLKLWGSQPLTSAWNEICFWGRVFVLTIICRPTTAMQTMSEVVREVPNCWLLKQKYFYPFCSAAWPLMYPPLYCISCSQSDLCWPYMKTVSGPSLGSSHVCGIWAEPRWPQSKITTTDSGRYLQILVIFHEVAPLNV